MTKIENKSHLSKYPNLSKIVSLNKNEVKAFLPFLKEFTFLQAKDAIRDLLVRYVETTGFVKTNGVFIDMTLISEAAFNIHAIIKGWDIRTHQNIGGYFDDLMDENPLVICNHIDNLIKQFAFNNDSMISEVIIVMVEFKRAYLRYFSLEKNIDLSQYLDSEI